ncbi:hypothetical protein L0152_08150 [bacterium]|nr:hypothetical protein [bacterium]
MENEPSTDQSNTIDHRTPIEIENEEKVPGKTDNPWKQDIFDDTDTNLRKEPKDPKRTLFY